MLELPTSHNRKLGKQTLNVTLLLRAIIYSHVKSPKCVLKFPFVHTGEPKLNNCHKIIFICIRNKSNSYFDISKIIWCTGSQDGRTQKNRVPSVWNHYRQAFETNNSNRAEMEMTKENCFSYMADNMLKDSMTKEIPKTVKANFILNWEN